MPRKRVKNSKTKVTRKAMYLSESMEKDFRVIPNKLPAQLTKELNGLKKQENKLQSSLLKMQKQQTAAKNKYEALALKAKTKLTASAKKQIKKATKTLEKLNGAASQLSDQLNDIQQHGKILSQKQAKFSEICKYIASIDEKWEKKYTKAMKATDKIKAVQLKNPRKNAKSTETIMTELPNRQEHEKMVPETVEA